jgi:hypothetical protein
LVLVISLFNLRKKPFHAIYYSAQGKTRFTFRPFERLTGYSKNAKTSFTIMNPKFWQFWEDFGIASRITWDFQIWIPFEKTYWFLFKPCKYEKKAEFTGKGTFTKDVWLAGVQDFGQFQTQRVWTKQTSYFSFEKVFMNLQGNRIFWKSLNEILTSYFDVFSKTINWILF